MGKCTPSFEKYLSRDEKTKNICLASYLRRRLWWQKNNGSKTKAESVEGHCSPMTSQTQTHSPFLKTFWLRRIFWDMGTHLAHHKVKRNKQNRNIKKWNKWWKQNKAQQKKGDVTKLVCVWEGGMHCEIVWNSFGCCKIGSVVGSLTRK